MKVRLTGQFLENGNFKRKDGTIRNFCRLLIGNDVHQVLDFVADDDVQKLDVIEIDADVRAYDSRLVIRAID